MPSSDRTPLLGSLRGRRARQQQPLPRLLNVLNADGEPSWTTSFRYFVLGSWFNVLLTFAPLSIVAHELNWDAGLRFAFSFLAIIPLARLLGDATNQMSTKVGQTFAGLLSASFGNAVEIIFGITSILQGELRIAQTAMLGSILSNLLLALGCSFVAGGFKFYECNFQKTTAHTSSSLMTLPCITLIIPATYHSSEVYQRTNNYRVLSTPHDASMAPPGPPRDEYRPGLLLISHGTSIVLVSVYIAYLFFQLKTHKAEFKKPERDENDGDVRANRLSAALTMLLSTVAVYFCAKYMIESIEQTATKYDIPRTFIGLILLPITVNAARHVTSVWMAQKGKMEASIAICVGNA